MSAVPFPREPVRVALLTPARDPNDRYEVGIATRTGWKVEWQGKPTAASSLNAAWKVLGELHRATGLPIVDMVSPRPRGGGGERVAA